MSYQGLDHLIKGRRKLTDDFLLRVSSLTSCSIHWLLTANGPRDVIDVDVSSGPLFKLEPKSDSEIFSEEERAAIRYEVIEVLGSLGLLLSGQAREMADSLLKTVEPEVRKPKGR